MPYFLCALTCPVADWWATLNNETSCGAEPDPNGGLAWLEAELEQAAVQGGPIWIIGSLPALASSCAC